MIAAIWGAFIIVSMAVQAISFEVLERRNYWDTPAHNRSVAASIGYALFSGLVLGNLATILIYEVVFCV